MKLKTRIRAGRIATNHNQAGCGTGGMKLKTRLKAGRLAANHNQAR